MANTSLESTINAIWRIESTKIIGALARIVHDVGLAEEFAQDAFVSAVEHWPQSGIPDNPGAWLMTTAKRRALDLLRRNRRFEQKQKRIELELERSQSSNNSSVHSNERDDLLGLIFLVCHPILSRDGRVALTLRLLGHLSTDEIARAFLVSETTMAQRLVRARRTLSEARVPFEIPRESELPERLSSVLEVLYLVFNEGYAATSGDSWMRPGLCEEALRLGRILAELMPDESEVHGLVALMELQASRLRARVDRYGEPILLVDQNRALWDHLLIHRGLAALERAERSGGFVGPYALQAAIAACHARARRAEETDWKRITTLYDALCQVAPSPVVELNRAIAISMAYDAAEALEIVDALRDEPALRNYHLLPAVRGTFLAKLGRLDEAGEEFKRASDLTQNSRERSLLLERAASCARGELPER